MINNVNLTPRVWFKLIRASSLHPDERPLDFSHISYCDGHSVYAPECEHLALDRHTSATVALLRTMPGADTQTDDTAYAIAVQVSQAGLGPDAPYSITGLFRLPASPGAAPVIFGIDSTPDEGEVTLKECMEDLFQYPKVQEAFDSLAMWCWTHNLYTSDKL